MVDAKEYHDLKFTLKSIVRKMDASEKIIGSFVRAGQLTYKPTSVAEARLSYSQLKSQIFGAANQEGAVAREAAEVEPVSSRLV